MYQILMSAAVEASGGWKNGNALSGPYCFHGFNVFRINDVEKVAYSSVQSIHRIRRTLTPNLVGEMLRSQSLLGPMGGHATMQHVLATPGVQAGLIVKVNYPWNYIDHAANCIILAYYTKGFYQQGPYPPACVKVLGRALTADEKLLLQDELGVAEANIQGNGINGCGKCWYANPNDDNVYTFTIPPSVMLKGAEDVDFVTIDGAEVKLDTFEEVFKINCKDLMSSIVRNLRYPEEIDFEVIRQYFKNKL